MINIYRSEKEVSSAALDVLHDDHAAEVKREAGEKKDESEEGKCESFEKASPPPPPPK